MSEEGDLPLLLLVVCSRKVPRADVREMETDR